MLISSSQTVSLSLSLSETLKYTLKKLSGRGLIFKYCFLLIIVSYQVQKTRKDASVYVKISTRGIFASDVPLVFCYLLLILHFNVF